MIVLFIVYKDRNNANIIDEQWIECVDNAHMFRFLHELARDFPKCFVMAYTAKAKYSAQLI